MSNVERQRKRRASLNEESKASENKIAKESMNILRHARKLNPFFKAQEMYNRQCKRLFDKIYVVGYGRLFFASNDYSYRLNNLPVEYYEKKEKAQDQEWQEEMKNVNLRFKSDIKELLQKFSKKQSDFKLNQYDTDDIYLTLLITTDGDLQELDEVQREIWAVIENFVPSEEHQFDAKSSSDEDDRSSNEIRQDEIRGEEERRYNHDWLSIMTEEEFAQRFEKL